MGNNLEILENWYEPFQHFKKLSLKEAKSLYLQWKEPEDFTERYKLKDELILGTMHVIYKRLKNSYFLSLPNWVINFEDVINASCEQWIKLVLDGKLMEVKRYTDFFTKSFFKNVGNSFQPESFSYNDYFECPKPEMITLISKYVLFRHREYTFSLQEFEETFKEIPASYYPLLENVYHMCLKMRLFKDQDELILRKVSFVIPLLVNQFLNVPFLIEEEQEIDELESNLEEAEKEVLLEQIREIYENLALPSKRSQKIVGELHGFYTYEKTPKELAKKYRISRQRISNLTANTYQRIKKLDKSSHLLENIQEELENS